MFGLKALASVLDSIDSAAKETLEEPKQSATVLRRARRQQSSENTSTIDAAVSDDGAVGASTKVCIFSPECFKIHQIYWLIGRKWSYFCKSDRIRFPHQQSRRYCDVTISISQQNKQFQRCSWWNSTRLVKQKYDFKYNLVKIHL